MTDKDLIVLAKNGDEEALTQLIVNYTPLLKKVIAPYKIVGADRDDLLQEATIALIKAVKHFSPDKGQTFSTFLYGVARQRIIDLLRSSKAQSQMALNRAVSFETLGEKDGTQNKVDPIDEDGDALDISIEKEEKDDLTQLIAGFLTARERQVAFEYMDGKSYQEIADTLNISIKTVDNTLAKVRKKMREKRELFGL